MFYKKSSVAEVTIRSLTFREVSYLSFDDVNNNDNMYFYNQALKIVTNCASRPGIDMNTFGMLLRNIISMSNIYTISTFESPGMSEAYDLVFKNIITLTKNFPKIFTDHTLVVEKENLLNYFKELFEMITPHVDHIMDMKLILYRKLHIQPSELDNMAYWEALHLYENAKYDKWKK